MLRPFHFYPMCHAKCMTVLVSVAHPLLNAGTRYDFSATDLYKSPLFFPLPMSLPLPSFTFLEKSSLFFMACLMLLGFAVPPIAQSNSYHQFANQHTWGGIPHFADVASNAVFLLTGLLGLRQIRYLGHVLHPAKGPLTFFFIGLLLTSLGSAYYHWAPTSATLVWDRIPMVLAFSGIIGTFLTLRVSPRMGRIGVIFCLLVGLLGLLLPGHLAWYLTLQFGGLHGLLIGSVCLKKGSDPFPWGRLLGWYFLAKLLEHFDIAIWELTQQIVSGHTLKHLAAGMAGVLLLKHLRAVPRDARGKTSKKGYLGK